MAAFSPFRRVCRVSSSFLKPCPASVGLSLAKYCGVGVQHLNLKDIPKAVYGGRHTVTLIPGDGIGPELFTFVKEIIRYSGAPVEFEEIECNRELGEESVDNALLSAMRNGVALKGNIENDWRDLRNSRNIALRVGLDCYANIVRCRSLPSLKTRHTGIDLVIIRENTEGEYSQLEHESVPGVVESLKVVTAAKSLRIARYAFEYAIKHNRKTVTCVHKANIMKLADGLFLASCAEVAKEYPSINFNNMIIDNCAMQMVSRPDQFDVLVVPNLYGNILGNIGTGLVGGPGMVTGANIGDKFAVFEQGTRNSGRSLMKKNIANPAALVMAGADMLDHLGMEKHADIIHRAVESVIGDDQLHTPDLGGTATTLEVVHAIIRHVQRLSGSA